MLAEQAATGGLHEVIASVMPAEIALMRIGPWAFVGWPGEAFVEFSLKVKSPHPNCYVISLANGELQGYLATEEAVRQGWYEAMNSLFASPESGDALVETTLELLRQWSNPLRFRNRVERDMAKILSIDLGTTYFKISLFDRNGRLCDTVPDRAAHRLLRESRLHGTCPPTPLADAILRGIAEASQSRRWRFERR